jgi:VCBS repeat-containing protein
MKAPMKLSRTDSRFSRRIQQAMQPFLFSSARRVAVALRLGCVLAASLWGAPVMVQAQNQPPTISNIGDRIINEDGTTGNISFTVGDPESPPAQLTVTAAASNVILVPSSSIVLGGSGANRTIRINPAADENGSATITVTVTDPDGGSASTTFLLIVLPVNDAPTITGALLGPLADPLPDNELDVTLFQNIVIDDVDQGRPGQETLTVTIVPGLDADRVGSLRERYTDDVLTGTITRTGTPASVTSQIRNIVFDPVPNLVPVGQTTIFPVTINVVDAAGAPAAGNGTERSVYVRSENDPPVLVATVIPSTIPDVGVVRPFQITVTDPDPGDESQGMVVTVENLTVGGSAFGTLEPPAPTFTGSRADVEAAVRALAFRPTPNSVAADQPLTFQVEVTDRNAGTTTAEVVLTLQGANDTPTVAGVAPNPLRLTDDPSQPPFRPFRGVRVLDPDENGMQSQTVTLTLGNSALGTLSATTLTGTPATVTDALQAVTFTPALRPDRVIGENVSTAVTIRVVDSLGATHVNSGTVLVITAVNGGPVISGLPETPPLLLPPLAPVLPFADLEVTDDDEGPLTFTLRIDNPAKGNLSNLGGFLQGPEGTYTRTGTPEEITLALQALEYTVSDSYVFPPNAPGGTTFALKAVDAVFNTTEVTLGVLLQNEPRNHLVILDTDEVYPDDHLVEAERGLPMLGTLRRAVLEAGNNDTITFDLPAYPGLIRLDVALGPIELRRNLTFHGPGADLLAISGDTGGDGLPDTQLFRVFALVTMEGLTLTEGRATTGGAVWVGPTGKLTLRYCAVTDSRAIQWGGAIDVDEGALHLEHCLLRGNVTDASLGLGGGAVSLYTTQPCSFVNSTFSANRQQAANGFGGGALYVEISDPAAALEVTLAHCTFADNLDAAENASSVLANVLNTVVTVRNSVFADGRDRNLGADGAGRIQSAGGNVSDDSTRVILTQAGVPKAIILLDQASDRTQVPAGLAGFNGELSPLGGYPPLPGSPALSRAVEPVTAVDMLGARRDSAPDAGALEFGASARMTLNEVQAADGSTQFLEFYVLRDSVPFDLSGYTVSVDGVLRHVFEDGTLVRPGAGVLVAESSIAALGGTPVQVPNLEPGLALELTPRGLIEVRTPGTSGRLVLRRSYLGVYADPDDPAQNLDIQDRSLTLKPQFRGFAYVPHPIEDESPGSDSDGTPFGSPNAFPSALDDEITVGEDDLVWVPVTANDFDADGSDRPVVIAVSSTPAPAGTSGSATTMQGAAVLVVPEAVPTRGTAIRYDPRASADLQSLPEGYERFDRFYYAIIDEGSGEIVEYQGALGDTSVTILSPNHRLAIGQLILVSDAGVDNYNGARRVTQVQDADRFTLGVSYAGNPEVKGAWTTQLEHRTGAISQYSGTIDESPVTVQSSNHGLADNQGVTISGASVASYNGSHVITRIDANTFTIPVAFGGNTTPRGSWSATVSRVPTRRSEAMVTVKVIGANDPPRPGPDTIAGEEETILRILGDPHLLGTPTVFDTDHLYPKIPQLAAVNLLANDDDIDTDDDKTTLRIVGVLSEVWEIGGYSGEPGQVPVTVVAPDHGLESGQMILISGYGGHPSYNAFHGVTVVDEHSFAIPVIFVDNAPVKGAWGILTDLDRLTATSHHGADVRLEIRVDRIETSIVYNPLPSAYLDGLAEGETGIDWFYYAVEDSHSAVSFAKVTVNVAGRNDPPQPVADPPALANLPQDQPLEDVIAGLDIQFYLPSGSGDPGRADIEVVIDGTVYVIDSLWVTDEETPITILTEDLLANDFDVDRSDRTRLRVRSVDPFSQQEAAVALRDDGSIILYDPSGSDRLDALARGEPVLDLFRVTITDDRGGDVESWVAVLVTGLNDTPVAVNDAATTTEDEVLSMNPLLNDLEIDINGVEPDNQLRVLPVPTWVTPLGAEATLTTEELIYDPTVSAYLNSLQQGAMVSEVIPYTAADGSLIFANNDYFKVEADGSGFVLDVLANDRNLTGSGGALTIVAVGTPNRDGTVSIQAGGTGLVYSPQVNFVGDEVFPYTVSDANGNLDRGVVVVRVIVNPLNGNLQANDDFFHVAKGQAPILPVLANDNLLPAPGSQLTITRIVQPPGRDAVEIRSTGIAYLQADAGPFPYETEFRYEVSGGGSARAVATVRVRVVDREGKLDVRPDTFSVPSDSSALPLDVLANDHILPGVPVVLSVAAIVQAPTYGIAEIEPDGARLLYTPAPGFVGQDQLSYLATDGLGGTGIGLVSITVGALYTANDIFTVAFNDPSTSDDDDVVTVLDVLANDRVWQSNPATLEIVGFSPATTSLGALTISADKRTLEFRAASGQVGEQEFGYTIRDGSTPPRTAQGRLTLVVIEAGVRANPDFHVVEVNSADNLLPVLANDAAVPDRGRRLTVAGIGTGLNAPNRGGIVTLTDSGDGLLYTPAPGFSGEETFTYTMTDSRSYDTAKVVIRVASGALVASDDAFTVFFASEPDDTNPGGSRPVSFLLPVLANDRVLPDLGQVLVVTGVGIDDINASNAPDRAGRVEISPDGTSLIYTPLQDFGFPYVERFTYEISDSTARRAEARVAITVQERTSIREMETERDDYSVRRDSVANVLPVLTNDDIKPAGAAGWVVTELSSTLHGGVVSISGRNVLYTPVPGFIGTDEFTYFVSDGVGGTGSAQVRVKVGDLPLCPDIFTVLSGSSDNALDVLANDGIRPGDLARFEVAAVTGAVHGTVVVDGGIVYYTPAASPPIRYPYDDRFEYVVLDDSGLEFRSQVLVTVYEEGSDRDDALVTITVVGVNDPPAITGTRSGLEVYHRGTIRLFATVTFTDPDRIPEPDLLTLRIVLSNPQHGYLADANGLPLTPVAPGEYLFSGTAEYLTALVRQLLFVPTTGDPSRVSPGVSEETRFTLYLSDPYVTVVDDRTTVIARHAETARLAASDGSSADEFGFSVGASRKLVAAGAPFDDDSTIQGSGNKTGSAYLYARDAGGANAWGEASKMVASLRGIGDEFGYSTDVNEDGTVLAVGARRAREAGINTGAAWIFRRTGDTWTELARLVAPGLASGDEFGFSVALNAAGDVLVVGAPKHRPGSNRTGAAFVFVRAPGAAETWAYAGRLQPTDGSTDDEFGRSVSVQGDWVLVGSPRHSPTNKKSGAGYLYRRQPAGTWAFVVKLRAAAGDNNDEFGHAVAIHDGWLAVGARLDEANGKKSGTVYLFQQSAPGSNTWTEMRMLQSPLSGIDDEYGFAVGLDREFLVVGARRESIAGRRAGAIYVHSRNSGGAGQWGLVERLIPDAVDRDDEFGYSVAIRQGVVAVGARRQQLDGRRFGATYVYQLRYNNAPLAIGTVPDMVALIETDFEEFLPTDLFADTDVGDRIVRQEVRMADGMELPSWLAFDSEQGACSRLHRPARSMWACSNCD